MASFKVMLTFLLLASLIPFSVQEKTEKAEELKSKATENIEKKGMETKGKLDEVAQKGKNLGEDVKEKLRNKRSSGYDAPSAPIYTPAPQPSYNAPEPQYNAPTQSNFIPTQSYSAPVQTYEAPQQQSYQAPVQTYEAPQQQSYQAPVQTYQAPQQSYQAPVQTYQAPQQSYRTPVRHRRSSGYGAAPAPIIRRVPVYTKRVVQQPVTVYKPVVLQRPVVVQKSFVVQRPVVIHKPVVEQQSYVVQRPVTIHKPVVVTDVSYRQEVSYAPAPRPYGY